MKKYFLIIWGILLIPKFSLSAISYPNNMQLNTSETAIKIEWDCNENAKGYYIYWGTYYEQMDQKIKINETEECSYTLTGLELNKKYYFRISSFDDLAESELSPIISTTTLSVNSAPVTPSDFEVASIDLITESSINLRWEKNTESDLAAYMIYYGESSGDYSDYNTITNLNLNSYTVSDLSSSKRYYFVITALDHSENESEKSSEIIADTLPDIFPPNVPLNLEVKLNSVYGMSVSFNGNNSNMADIKGYKIYYGIEPANYTNNIDIGNITNYELSNLAENTIYYFSVSAYDYSGNESGLSSEASAKIEPTRILLTNPDEFEGGCYINSIITEQKGSNIKKFFNIFFFSAFALFFMLSLKKRYMFMAFILILIFNSPSYSQDKNGIGIKIGKTISSEDIQKDIYTDDFAPVTLFYERNLFYNVFADFEIGVVKKNGLVLTSSGTKTDIDTKLLLIPISSSIKMDIELSSLILCFIGGGFDFWGYREKDDKNTYSCFDDDKYGVSGYHGKAGFKFMTEEPEYYKKVGIVIEAVYSRIDKFGQNEIDLGGWIFNFGFLYTF
ncbi:MAG: fibronectin type III domain-containing protein [Desulfobacterales bacterium]|nr:fibronectin type III domain-containing protein [Desulfobacterales bacterium]